MHCQVLDVLSTLDEKSRKIVEECYEKEEEEEEEEQQRPDWEEAVEEEWEEEHGGSRKDPTEVDLAFANALRINNEKEATLLRRGGLKESIRWAVVHY